ncbi:pyridoxal-phosphate dependent enzyme [Streptomonospora nanhaiensis]|uniref:Threonine synthase n=1 Tax=Streptomonospora nanhaiensis TaxID=1323731 RepID=A0A853BTC8_9ACTN|nr:pyridoxal-phosphate dependent enzyme [Streptomonospora nanhaiensis]MBV2365446.1 pyridoxal-phosphate dependent enzyme [Streptomonospora nanhaiensis]MBX9389736.1 pyridoxal-phosphate dependent enzyme [Streptomonospora nanhaiensis]NYI98393.1 threonine synthase [Streptomonospora nanhaiensis]
MGFNLCYEQLIGGSVTASEGAQFALACVVCGRAPGRLLANRCGDCGGAIDAIHPLENVSLSSGDNPIQRYFDLLPVRDRGNVIWLGDGDTPCFRAEGFGHRTGIPGLVLKDESANPTRSTKDRIASVGLSRFAELGVKRFVMASTGNSSTAYARGVQSVTGFEMALFCGVRFRHRLNYPDHSAVTTYLVEGDFVAAGQAARRFAERTGALSEGGFFNLARREGLKLAYLEAFDWMADPPDYVFQAVSSGMGLLGAYKGALEYQRLGRLSRLPRFVAVQQSSCAPMAHAYGEGAEEIAPRHVVHDPRGLAEAILRGNPGQTYPYIRYLCHSTGGRIMAVDDDEIRRARALLEDTEGVAVCHASATALAGAVRMRREGALPEDASVLVNLTGGERIGWPVPTRCHVVDAEFPSGPVEWGGPGAPPAGAAPAGGQEGRDTCVL